MMVWLLLILVSFMMDKWLAPLMLFTCLLTHLLICVCINNGGTISTIVGGMTWTSLLIMLLIRSLLVVKLGLDSWPTNWLRTMLSQTNAIWVSPNVLHLSKTLCLSSLLTEPKYAPAISSLMTDTHMTNIKTQCFSQLRMLFVILILMRLVLEALFQTIPI